MSAFETHEAFESHEGRAPNLSCNPAVVAYSLVAVSGLLVGLLLGWIF